VLSSRYLAVVTGIGAVVAAVATPLLVGSASAAGYTASGTIQRAATGGVSATDTEFRNTTCPDLPSTQGTDAWVFALPSANAVAGTTVTLTAPSTAPHDLAVFVYDADCTYDRTVSTASSFDLALTLGADDTYLSVYSTSGSNIAVSLTATPGASSSTFSGQGSITRQNPTGVGVTDTEFSTTCPAMPKSQGVDGFVFKLPSSYAVAGTTVSVTATPTTHDLAAYVYKADCTFDRTEDDAASTDLGFTLADGDTFLSVYSTTGANLTVNLTATPGSTSTPSVSPTATPTGGGGGGGGGGGMTRHTYPATPNDPLFAQSGTSDLLLAGQWGMRKINAPQAWQENRATGAGITVADLDSGLDLGHPDFACPGKITTIAGSDITNNDSVPQDDNGHGTHTAGIIGACTNNGTGVVGVAPDASIMPVKVLDADGSGNADQLAAAIRLATDNGAHVINMSIGFGVGVPVVGVAVPYSGTAVGALGGLAIIDAAVDYAESHGVVVVAAAGNETAALCGYPAFAKRVVCVGASDPRDLNSWYGNFPVKTDDDDTVGAGLLAPGGTGVLVFCDYSASEIISTYDRAVDAADGDCDTLPGYASIQGTSMATPHVTGVAALVYDRLGGVRSAANAAKVVEALTQSAKDLYAPGYDPMSGYGRVDALAAVDYWPAATDPSPTVSPSPTATPTPTAKATALTIGSGVPATVQYGDSLSLSATLKDDTGAPVVGEPVTFQLQGTDAFREASGVTGPDGTASATLTADVPPGSYRVAVGYSGKTDTYGSSSASQPIAVTREDSATRLVVSGTGSKRVLTATVAETDVPNKGIAGVTVVFYADGQQIGTAVTNASGVATLSPPSGARSAHTYEGRFAGDAFYLPSAGSA
jgi:serine protease